MTESVMEFEKKSLKSQKGESTEMKFSLSNPLLKQIPTTDIMDAKIESSDFDQWLQAMKMVARLPGGMPPEFRRKLWLALSEKYLQTKNMCWEKEEEKCFSETYREDDEELGIQIVKDLHRTGSSLCSGPAGSINQAKLKKILLGYARWNPEVGYCQGFNMLGALILQVMDKNEIESIKVMIYLVEGVLPQGYFSGSLGGLQADMAVFRELMTTRLPRLAKHLQKLQGPIGEGSFEPPLTNVFTMQWFLTMFCTCLPINCVLRVWDLVLIEGSDVLLRTALSIWSILEERVINIKTADDFYCKMGTLSGELLNGHLIDSNGLIERVVKLGPIPDLQKMRDKHLYNLAPWRDKKGLKLYYSDEEADSDDDSHLAVTTASGIRGNRRGSSGLPSSSKTTSDNKDRLALDISILKKQYERLRERQRQAHIILTTAVARQAMNASSSPSLQMNQLLLGRNAIVTNKGRRIGPPPGAIPPIRKTPPLTMSRQIKKNEMETMKHKKNITMSKDVSQNIDIQKQSESANSSLSSGSERGQKLQTRSESSSYSEDSDDSSTSTSLCDEENESHDVFSSSVESSPLRKQKTLEIETEVPNDRNESAIKATDCSYEFYVDSNIARSNDEVPNVSLSSTTFATSEENLNKATENKADIVIDEDSSVECDRFNKKTFSLTSNEISTKKDNLEALSIDPIDDISFKSDSVSASVNNCSFISNSTEQQSDYLNTSQSPLEITSTSQLSPIADISKYLSISSISPLKTPSLHFDYTDLISCTKENENNSEYKFSITDEGVTNEYFERVNIVERPKYLDLSYSFLNNDDKWTKKDEVEMCRDSEKITLDSLLSKTLTKNEELSPQVNPINSPKTPEINITEFSTQTDSAFETGSKHNFPKYDLIFEKTTFNDQTSCIDVTETSQTPTKNSSTDEIEYEVDLLTSKSLNIEKSFSFHKPISNEEKYVRPTSCPEVKFNNDENRIPTDRVLKIIEENSQILHRILKKTISDTQNKENLNSNVSQSFSNRLEIESLIENKNSLINTTESPAFKSNFINNQLSMNYKYPKIDDESKQTEMLCEKIDFALQSKSTTDIKTISLRTEDNITDRLESIKNTIKSIDSLCEDRSSYRKEKCQKYIDSLFEKSNDNFKIKNTTPMIEIKNEDNPYHHYHQQQNDKLIIDDNNIDIDNTFFSSYSNTRYSRDIKREVSPRRRKDEDREEYESRIGRDKVAKYFDSSIDNTPTIANIDFDENINEKQSIDQKLEIFTNDNKWLKDLNSTDIMSTSYTETSSFSKDDEKSITNPPFIYKPSKLELRHTTVTCTFYDRYLSQKLERNARAAKSERNNTLKPTITTISTPLYDRNSKSTESSPSRNQISLTFSSSDNNSSTIQLSPQISSNERHSYDNILSRLKSTSTTSTNNDMHSLSSSALSTKKTSDSNSNSSSFFDSSSYKDIFKDLPKS